MFPTLGALLADLTRRGELRRIEEPVDARLEASEFALREARSPAPTRSASASRFDPERAMLGGRALLFERIEGCDLPLCMNVFGSYRRMETALGVADDPRGLEAIADRIAALVRPTPPASIVEMFSAARRVLPLLRIAPRRVRNARCQQVLRLASRGEVDLRRIPLIRCWPHDGNPLAVGSAVDAVAAGTAGGDGRFVTFAGMHTIHADDRGVAKPASHNIGMYRAQLIGPTRLAMHWHMHHDGASHWRSWKRLGERMPIAICFGGESVMAYGATAPLPPGISELLMCGFLNGRGIPLVPARTVPIRVPANSELVIEGWVDTRCGFPGWDPSSGEPIGDGAVFEGPFGDHTGFYSLPDRYPIVEVTAVTHARDAVIPATVVGPPPQEDYYLGKATERIFLPLLRTLVPDVDDYHLPLFGCFHNAAFVRIRKAYPMQARRVMHSAWGAGQMAWTKIIAVVDESVDVHDERGVWRAIFERCHFGRDVESVHGPLDILDHAAPWLGAGTKIGLDATGAGASEALHGVPPGSPRPPGADHVAALVAALDAWRHGAARAADEPALVDFDLPEPGLGRCAILSIRKARARDGARAIEALWTRLDAIDSAHLADFAVVLDADADVRDFDDALFLLAANIDPGRDRHARGVRIAFDATRKLPGDERLGFPVRPFPDRLEMDAATTSAVDARMGPCRA